MEKYFNKGFDVVLPRLDVSKLPRHYIKLPELCDAAEMPGLSFAYNAIHGNKIFVQQFLQTAKQAESDAKEEKKDESLDTKNWGRSYESSGDDDGKSHATVLAENIQKLCAGQYDNFSQYADGDYLLKGKEKSLKV